MGWVGPAIQLGGAVLGGLSGGKGGGGSTMPGFAKKAGKLGSQILRDAAQRPAEDSIAKFNPDQLQAFQMTRDAVGTGLDDMLGAQATAKRLSAGVTDEDIARFQSPYQSQVIDAALADIENMRATRQVGANAEAVAAGAFGGDRQGVYRAVLDGQYDRTGASTIAGLRDQGFRTAAGLAMDNNKLALAGNDQLMNMINNRRAALYGDAGAMSEIGGVQYGRDQAVLDNPVKMGSLLMSGASGAAGGGSAQPGLNPLQGAIGGLQFGRDIYDIGKGIFGGWGIGSPKLGSISGPYNPVFSTPTYSGPAPSIYG